MPIVKYNGKDEIAEGEYILLAPCLIYGMVGSYGRVSSMAKTRVYYADRFGVERYCNKSKVYYVCASEEEALAMKKLSKEQFKETLEAIKLLQAEKNKKYQGLVDELIKTSKNVL